MNRKRTKKDTAMDAREKSISRDREQTGLLLRGQRRDLRPKKRIVYLFLANGQRPAFDVAMGF